MTENVFQSKPFETVCMPGTRLWRLNIGWTAQCLTSEWLSCLPVLDLTICHDFFFSERKLKVPLSVARQSNRLSKLTLINERDAAQAGFIRAAQKHFSSSACSSSPLTPVTHVLVSIKTPLNNILPLSAHDLGLILFLFLVCWDRNTFWPFKL